MEETVLAMQYVLHFSVWLLFKTFISFSTYLTRYAQGHEDMHTDLHVVFVLSVVLIKTENVIVDKVQ